MINAIFSILLKLYPKSYQEQFRRPQEDLIVDMMHDQTPDWKLLFFIFHDTLQGVVHAHIYSQKQKINHLIHANYTLTLANYVGGILLFPLCFILVLSIIGRIIQHDVTSPNGPLTNWLYHTPLYYYPVLFCWVILFPCLAILMNGVSLLVAIIKKKKLFQIVASPSFLVSISIVFIATLFLAVLKLHDFVPCMLHSYFSEKISNFGSYLTICGKA